MPSVILRSCPACGCGHVETVHALRAVGTSTDGRPVLRDEEVFACTACEWVRSVRGELWRQQQEPDRTRGVPRSR